MTKGNGLHMFWEEIFAKYLQTTRQKKICTFFIITHVNFGKDFCIFEMAWLRAF